MERRKKNDNGGEIRFKKIGRGSLRIGKKIIKPGQIFRAHPNDISQNFKDVVVPLEQSPEQHDEAEITKAEFVARHRSDRWYDVINGEEKKMNEKAMTREDAEKFIEDLKQG